jgi:hypothetical protein
VHTPYSEPGRHRLLLQQLPDQVDGMSAAARNVIGHYRAELADLPGSRREEINSRWLESILDLDQDRHRGPLDEPRDLSSRVAGCCSDHSSSVLCANASRPATASASPATCCRVTTSTTSSWRFPACPGPLVSTAACSCLSRRTVFLPVGDDVNARLVVPVCNGHLIEDVGILIAQVYDHKVRDRNRFDHPGRD